MCLGNINGFLNIYKKVWEINLDTRIIRFTEEDLLIGSNGNYEVPDVLLIKPWFESNFYTSRNKSKHVKQLVTRNQLELNQDYEVNIQLMDYRIIKQSEQYTYEMTFYLNGVLKATVISTYLEEVSHAISNL